MVKRWTVFVALTTLLACKHTFAIDNNIKGTSNSNGSDSDRSDISQSHGLKHHDPTVTKRSGHDLTDGGDDDGTKTPDIEMGITGETAPSDDINKIATTVNTVKNTHSEASATSSSATSSLSSSLAVKWTVGPAVGSTHVSIDVNIKRTDPRNGGLILMPVSVVAILVNGFILVIVCINWEKISDSNYYNSSLLYVLLTVSDLALSFLIGIPVGIRLLFMRHFKDNLEMNFYTENMAMFIFEYLIILRVILIAVISVEKCAHIMNPFRYLVIATKTRAKVVCGIIGIIPLLRMVPMIYALSINPKVTCDYAYIDDHGVSNSGGDKSNVPLTCQISEASAVLGYNFTLVDVSLFGVVVGCSWIVIIVSNVVLLIYISKVMLASRLLLGQRADSKKSMKGGGLVFIIAFSFALTNFPYASIWIAEYVLAEDNYILKFYLIMITFMSLLFHPFLYALRMRSITKLITGSRAKFSSLFGITYNSPATR